jgi:Flp pilus assembly protein TadD
MADDTPLADQRVAFTGRLASMSRAAAFDVVLQQGGTASRTVSRCTALLVVGQEGWPFAKDGRPTAKLRRARTLARAGYGIEILPEEVFLQRAGVVSAGGVLELHPLNRVSELAGVPRSRLEVWIRAGLLSPTGETSGVPLFDYRGVSAARSLVALLGSGTSVRRVVRSLRMLSEWLPGAGEQADLLSRLSIEAGRLLFRTRDGRPVEPTGQLQLPLEATNADSLVVRLAEHQPADALFAQAIDRERDGDLASAVELYRRVLLAEGPDPDVLFNLGNALMALGQLDAAAERFRQAAEADPSLADAWHNLGNVLLETGRCADAIVAYSKAIAAGPGHADAHYGLAGALEECARFDKARVHWKAYLNLEPSGECADYARRRLIETEARPTG